MLEQALAGPAVRLERIDAVGQAAGAEVDGERLRKTSRRGGVMAGADGPSSKRTTDGRRPGAATHPPTRRVRATNGLRRRVGCGVGRRLRTAECGDRCDAAGTRRRGVVDLRGIDDARCSIPASTATHRPSAGDLCVAGGGI